MRIDGPTRFAQERGTGRRRLIINADDFGLTPAVNQGILDAHRAGCVTSASLLVNLPGFPDAVVRARTAPRLGVGLHLNLTAGAPVAGADAVPTLCDPGTGHFLALPRLAARALAGRIAAGDVLTECAAQIGRLRDAGVAITHMDGHRHVHLLPGIWKPFLQAARQAGIPVVRMPLERLRHTIGSLAFAEQVALRIAHRLAGEQLAHRHVDDFRGSTLLGRARFRDGVLRVIDTLRPGLTELMVHPGYYDDEVAQWDRYTWQRERELRGLVDPVVRARLAQSDIELVHFGALARDPAATRSRPLRRRGPRFSVVVPAYNEARYLPRLLDSIDVARAAYGAAPGAIEVIVADNDSTDATATIAAVRGCRVARQPKRVISAVRNAGAAIARGQILAFIDADSQLHPDTFDAIDRALAPDVIGGATGVTMDRWSTGALMIFTVQELAGRVTGWDTGVVFCRRADFATVGGYDENVLFSEDFAFYGALRRLARTRRQRFVRLHGVRAVTSARKFEQFGNLKWPLANLAVLGLTAIHAPGARALVERYWYRARS